VVKVGVKGKIKSAEFGREGKRRGLFQGARTFPLIAVHAGHKLAVHPKLGTVLGARSRNHGRADAALLGELELDQ
jgi:hypothetical protein